MFEGNLTCLLTFAVNEHAVPTAGWHGIEDKQMDRLTRLKLFRVSWESYCASVRCLMYLNQCHVVNILF